LAMQDIQGLEDEPRQKVMVELRRRAWQHPLGQDRRGTVKGIKSLTAGKIRKHYGKLFGPRNLIVSVAGNIDWPALKDQVETLFGDWHGGNEQTVRLRKPLGGRA